MIHATQRPASFAGLAEPSGPPAWKDIPSWAIIGRQDRIIDPVSLRAMAEHAGADDHRRSTPRTCWIRRPPDAVVEVIEQALREVGRDCKPA